VIACDKASGQVIGFLIDNSSGCAVEASALSGFDCEDFSGTLQFAFNVDFCCNDGSGAVTYAISQ
jgi:hypothetical protein